MESITEKACSRCKKVLPVSEFYPHRRMKHGLQSQCRVCAQQWARDHPEYIKEKGRKWRADNPTYSTDWQRRKNFGVSSEAVSDMLLEQNGLCAGCGRKFGPGLREYVDHCHKTGKIRGLLCNGCNVSLGRLRDDPETLRRLADYVTRKEA
jgi:hypothetical protein